MIVLDTNALMNGGWGQGTGATLLRGLSRACGHPLAIPEIVLDEDLADRRREVQGHLDASDLRELQNLVPWWLGRADVVRGGDEPLPTAQSAVSERDRALRRVFLILPTPETAPIEAHRREMERLPPASPDGGEGRDVVVWLTAIGTCPRVLPSILYFVSGDGTFRTEGTSRLKPALAGEAPRNLHFIPSIDAMVDRLSCAADPDQRIADHGEVLRVIEQTAVNGHHDNNHPLRRDLWDWTPPGVRGYGSDLRVSASLVDDFSPRIVGRTVGETSLTAIDAVYRLELQWPTGNEAIRVRLGILVNNEGGEMSAVRVLSSSGIRLAE